MYCAYVTTIKNLRKHSNADRLQCATIFGNNVIVDLSYYEGQRVVYFPVDGQLGGEFARENNLVRVKDVKGNNIGGYLDPKKRNIKALKLRGEQSDGLVLPIEVLSKYTDIGKLTDGEQITTLNGCEICKKYIPKINRANNKMTICKLDKEMETTKYPYFNKHIDTAQLAYNLNEFRIGDLVEITLKMHGTSQRTAYTLAQKEKEYPWLINEIRRLFKLKPKIIENYDYVSGTRRCTLENYDGGYYGDNNFRRQHHNKFVGKLHKGEEVFYEVVGFTDNGTPIMPTANNKQLNDEEFVKKYGSDTIFSYGCDPDGCDEDVLMKFEIDNESDKLLSFTQLPKSDVYVYRMTMTNPDGEVVEYSYDYMKHRCEQMDVKVVPLLWQGIVPPDTDKMYETAGKYIKEIAEKYYDGIDPVGTTHWREGVVVRIENRPSFTAYKHKNFIFKQLSGIAIEQMAGNENINAISEDVIEEM